ncbi:MAG TPA: L,D-transpeptidase family protein [Anaerolineales bacterium]|nr:L,D-transpeptidase family protein [Anaerolineales bacterium]
MIPMRSKPTPIYPPASRPARKSRPNGQAARPRPANGSAPQTLVERLAPYSFWVLLLAAFAGLFFILAGALGFFAYYQVTERIYPGVHAGSIDLGGMQVPDAAVAIHQVYNLDRRIVLDDGLQPRSLSPSELGISVDAVATAEAAYATGHRKDLFFRFGAMLTGLTEGVSITPVIQFDEARAWQTMADISAQITVPARDAAIQFQDDQLVALPASPGYTLNHAETLAPILLSPANVLSSGYLKAVLLPLSPAVTDAAPQLEAARAFLDAPHRIEAFDPIRNQGQAWEIERSLLAGWLAVSNQAGAVQLDLSVPAVEAHLANLSAQLGDNRRLEPAQDAPRVVSDLLAGQVPALRIYHSPSSYTVQPGDTLLRIAWQVGMPFWIIAQANPGLDIDHLTLGQTLVLPSLDEMLPLPVVPGKRIVMSIGQQRMEIFENGEKLHKFVISTGIDRSPTQPGIFQVQTHDLSAYASVWDLTMPHFLGIYEAWPGFMNGIHGLPTLSNGRRLWANILGKPASYGCIILDLNNAEWLYNWAEDGVVVEITR